MRHVIPAVLAVGLLAGGCSSAREDKAAIQGAWYVVAAEQSGQVIPEDGPGRPSVSFVGDKFTFRQEGRVDERTFTLNATTRPKQIDLEREHIEEGIYELNGDNLNICVDQLHRGRPRSFDAAKEFKGGYLLMFLKRK